MLKIYVMGPLTDITTTGSLGMNMRQAILAAEKIRRAGALPYVPHLSVFWDMTYPHGYDWWMELDRDWLSQMDAAYRVPGVCPGCERETEWCEELGLEIFTNLELLQKWIQDHDYQIGQP